MLIAANWINGPGTAKKANLTLNITKCYVQGSSAQSFGNTGMAQQNGHMVVASLYLLHTSILLVKWAELQWGLHLKNLVSSWVIPNKLPVSHELAHGGEIWALYPSFPVHKTWKCTSVPVILCTALWSLCSMWQTEHFRAIVILFKWQPSLSLCFTFYNISKWLKPVTCPQHSPLLSLHCLWPEKCPPSWHGKHYGPHFEPRVSGFFF